MNRLILTMSVVAALVTILSGPVSAGLTQYYDFTHTWSETSYGHIIANENGSSGKDFTDSYDIRSWLTAHPDYHVTGAELTLELIDDDDDGTQLKTKERVEVFLETTAPTNLWYTFTEVGTKAGDVATHTDTVTLDWLADGILPYWIDLTNDGPSATVGLSFSTLKVGYDVVPVPLPASILLGVFAVGLAGRKLRKFV
jgi:hypothetical protein